MRKNIYEGTVYRPPSEWNSLIIQSTIGCSHNKCTFCSMYKGKKFRIKTIEQVKEDILIGSDMYKESTKVFLADGDALIRKTSEQLEILSYIKTVMPQCERVTCYGSPKSILGKSHEELVSLKNAGLQMVYLGLESGSNQVLERINKGATSSEIIKAAKLIKEAGIKLSVTAIIGIGGKELSKIHGIETGKVLSKMRADYIGLLTLMLENGTKLEEQYERGEFEFLCQEDILRETQLIVENLDSPGSVFRANHASNYLNLSGTLNEDKERILDVLNRAINGQIYLKQDKYRGL